MNKFLKVLKYVFSLGILLWTDYQKEQSKTKVLIHNVNQLLEVTKDVYESKGGRAEVAEALNTENLKNMLGIYQTSKGLYDEIRADVKANK